MFQLLAILMLLVGTVSPAAAKKNCSCKECPCTKEKNCGCMSGKECQCGEKGGCQAD